MHLLGALGDDDQVEAELASLAGDADGVLGRQGRDRVGRVGGADVVGLVDHDRHRLPRGAAPPEPVEHVAGDRGLLLARRQRSEVDHGAARAVGVLQAGRQRVPLRAGPDAPSVDAQVVAAQLERLGLDTRQVREAADPLVLDQGRQLGVLLAIGQRVEAQQGGLLRRAQLAEADPDGVGAVGAAPDRDRLRHRAEALGRLGVGAGPGLGQADVVGVRVQHHDAQARLHQEALEQDAERVGLAGARLPAQERVAAEAGRVEGERDAAGERELADVQGRALGARTLEPGAHLVRQRGAREGVMEGPAVAVEDDPLAAADPDPHLRQPGAGCVLAAHLERQDLAQAGRAAGVERHVAARLEVEAVQGRLEAEAGAVDRARERQHRRLELLPDGAVLLERGLDVVHRPILSREATTADAATFRTGLAPRSPSLTRQTTDA